MSKRIIRCPKCGEKENISAYSNNPNIRQCCACNFKGNYGAFEAFIPSVFDRITVSPEALAHTYIYTVLSTDNEVFFCSALLSPTQTFVHLDEAIAATLEKLKEVDNG